MASRSSSLRSVSASRAPRCPSCASPQSMGRPTKTIWAPSASALSTSVPRRTPPSMKTGSRPASALTTGCSASTVARQPSSCRPPWLETMTPLAPCSAASRASSGVMMPLTSTGSPVMLRSQLRSAHVSVGSRYLIPKSLRARSCAPVSLSLSVECSGKLTSLWAYVCHYSFVKVALY